MARQMAVIAAFTSSRNPACWMKSPRKVPKKFTKNAIHKDCVMTRHARNATFDARYADGRSRSQVKCSLGDLDHRELRRSDITQQSHDAVIETSRSLAWQLEVSHKPVQNLNHIHVTSGDQAQERHRLPVAQEDRQIEEGRWSGGVVGEPVAPKEGPGVITDGIQVAVCEEVLVIGGGELRGRHFTRG